MKMRFILSLVLAMALVLSPLRLEADDVGERPTTLISQQTDSRTPELKWRQYLQRAKESRSGLIVVGAIAGFAGAGLAIAGNLKAASAEDVQGCSRDGLFTVTCSDENSLNEAQGRIDDGRRLAVIGLISGVVAVGFLVGGARQSRKIDDLERRGRREGYKLSLDSNQDGGIQMLVSKSF